MQTDLFAEPEPKPLDWYLMHVREKYPSLPDGWTIESLERLSVETADILITGAVYPLLTKGKYAGRPNWRAKVPGTDRRVVIRSDEHDAFRLRWEASTGKCHVCEGTGQQVIGWDHIKGTLRRPCTRCDATGNAPERRNS